MNLEKTWLVVKKWLVPTFLLPLFLIIMFDYLRALLWFGQVMLSAFLLLQSLATVGGFVLGAVRHTSPENPWLQITDFKIVRIFPTILLGEKVFAWAMSQNKEEECQEETSTGLN